MSFGKSKVERFPGMGGGSGSVSGKNESKVAKLHSSLSSSTSSFNKSSLITPTSSSKRLPSNPKLKFSSSEVKKKSPLKRLSGSLTSAKSLDRSHCQRKINAVAPKSQGSPLMRKGFKCNPSSVVKTEMCRVWASRPTAVVKALLKNGSGNGLVGKSRFENSAPRKQKKRLELALACKQDEFMTPPTSPLDSEVDDTLDEMLMKPETGDGDLANEISEHEPEPPISTSTPLHERSEILAGSSVIENDIPEAEVEKNEMPTAPLDSPLTPSTPLHQSISMIQTSTGNLDDVTAEMMQSPKPAPPLAEDVVDASVVTATVGRCARRISRTPRGTSRLSFLPTPLRVPAPAAASLDRSGSSRRGSSLTLVHQDDRIRDQTRRLSHSLLSNDQPSTSARRDLPETVRSFDVQPEASPICVMSVEEFEHRCLRDRAHSSDTAVPILSSYSPMAVVTSIVHVIPERLVSASSKMYRSILDLVFGKDRNEPNAKECESNSLPYPEGLNHFLFEVDNFPERIIPPSRSFWHRSNSHSSSYDKFVLKRNRAEFPSDINALERFLRAVRREGQEFARAIRWGIVNPAKYIVTEPTTWTYVAYFAAEQAVFVIFQEF